MLGFATAWLGLSGAAVAAAAPRLVINEVLASHSGRDDTEFVELAGPPGASLFGLSLIAVEGDAQTGAGQIEQRIDFTPADRIGPNGFYLIGNCAGLQARYDTTPDRSISAHALENSSQTLALVVTDSITGRSASNQEWVLDAVALRDPGAIEDGDLFFFDAPLLGPDRGRFPAGVRRRIDGLDTDTASDFLFADFDLGPENTPTGGGRNGCVPLPLSISEIQGSGPRSAFAGERVQVRGIVTLETKSGDGLWIQDLAGDGDPRTSDGVFIALGANDPGPVRVGDLVSVEARVEELQFGSALPLTRLGRVERLVVESAGYPLPSPVPLHELPDRSIAEGIEFFEALEGMRVAVERGRVVGPTTRFGEFVLLAGKNLRPGSGYFPSSGRLLLRGLGQNRIDFNPERILVGSRTLDRSFDLRTQDRVASLTGVLDYSFGNYKIEPDTVEVERQALPRSPASRRRGPNGDTVITTFNVENLFDRSNAVGKSDPVPGDASVETKLEKLALAMLYELSLPDVVVVQEIENQSILQELADRVNSVAETTYEAVSFDSSDVRGIEVGFMYDRDRVTLIEAFPLQGPDVEAVFGSTGPSPGREPLVGRFEVAGQELWIIGNHFRSKRGDDPLFGTHQPPLRPSEETRKAQARVVRNFASRLLESDPQQLVLIAGDLNDFQFGEPGEGLDHPLAILEGRGRETRLSNLIRRVPAASRFTFVFDGNAQVLDHMLASPALVGKLRGIDILHFNSGFPTALEADPSVPFRSSDHDPVEARFSLRSKIGDRSPAARPFCCERPAKADHPHELGSPSISGWANSTAALPSDRSSFSR